MSTRNIGGAGDIFKVIVAILAAIFLRKKLS